MAVALWRKLWPCSGKADFNGIWEANNTANWDLQTHGASRWWRSPEVAGSPGLQRRCWTGSMAGSVRVGIVEGEEEFTYHVMAAARRKRNLEHGWIATGDQVLPARRARARCTCRHPFRYPSAPRSTWCLNMQRAAHDPPEQDGRLSERAVDGVLVGPGREIR